MTWRGAGTPAPPAPKPQYVGRHRAPRPLVIDEERIPAQYDADFARHLADGRTPADAEALAWQDADSRLTDWLVAS